MDRSFLKKLRIGFVTGSRSDFAKIRPYLQYFHLKAPTYLLATGMHSQKTTSAVGSLRYGLTKETRVTYVQADRSSMTREMECLVGKISDFLVKNKISFLFLHGDRVETLAGAVAAACMQIPICHLEAGDESGNIDEIFRHAITKLANRFLVDDEIAKQIVLQLGEDPSSVHVVGNLSLSVLPSKIGQQRILKKYNLLGKKYVVVLYHPETYLTALEQYRQAMQLVKLLQKINVESIIISPNNDPNAESVERAYRHIKWPAKRIFYSFPLEEYLTLLQHSVCLIGNSSSCVKEAPLLEVPAILIGQRQRNRFVGRKYPLLHCVEQAKEVEPILEKLLGETSPAPHRKVQKRLHYLSRLDKIFTRDFFFPSLQKEFHAFRKPR